MAKAKLRVFLSILGAILLVVSFNYTSAQSQVVARYDFEDGTLQGFTSYGWRLATSWVAENPVMTVIDDGFVGSKYAISASNRKTERSIIVKEFIGDEVWEVTADSKLVFAYKIQTNKKMINYRITFFTTDGKNYNLSPILSSNRWDVCYLKLGMGSIPLGSRVKKIEFFIERERNTTGECNEYDFRLDNVVIYQSDEEPPALFGKPQVKEYGTDLLVSWQLPYDAVGIKGYNIYRGLSQDLYSPGNKINTDLINDKASYRDIGATGRPYRYLIEAVDFDGNTSVSEISEPAEPEAEFLPNVPVLTGTSQISGKVELAWADPLPNNLGILPAYYRLYRSEALSELGKAESLVADKLKTYKWSNSTGVVPGKEYYYLLTAVDEYQRENFAGSPVKIKVSAENSPNGGLNLFPNGSFENGTTQPTGWSPIFNGIREWDHQNSSEGNASVKVASTPTQNRGGWRAEVGGLTAGKVYRFSVDYKTESAYPMVNFYVRPATGATNLYLSETVPPQMPKYWSRVEDTFVCPNTGVKLIADLYLWFSEGTVWFDNVELVELPIMQGPRMGESVNSRPRLAWEPVVIANTQISYNLQYSQSADFPVGETYTIPNIQEPWYQIVEPLESGVWYWRLSIKAGSNVSPYSAARSFTVNNTGPNAPTGVVVSSKIAGALTLTWDPVAGASSYRIYRSTNSGATLGQMTMIADVESAEYIDPDVEAGNTYYYRICAVDETSVEGLPSSVIEGLPSGELAVPQIPVDVKASTDLPGKIKLTWNKPNSDLSLSYNIYRREQGQGEFKQVATGIENLVYEDFSVSPGVLYEYAVTSVRLGKQSSQAIVSNAKASAMPVKIVHYSPSMAAIGKTVQFSAAVEGDAPKSITLHYSYDGENFYQLPMEKDKDGQWRLTLTMPNVPTFSYYLTAELPNWIVSYPQSAPENLMKLDVLAGDVTGRLQISNMRITPNLFNPGTGSANIAYILGRDANVTVDIYTTSGQLVRRLVDGKAGSPGATAGVNYAEWDGKDSQGKTVRSGPYLLLINARQDNAVSKAQALIIVVK